MFVDVLVFGVKLLLYVVMGGKFDGKLIVIVWIVLMLM